MADLPIPFTADMVRGLLREIEQPGTGKTQTRRLASLPVQTEPILEFVKVGTEKASGRSVYEMLGTRPLERPAQHVAIRAGKHSMTTQFMPRYAVGDRLWVREAWRVSKSHDAIKPRDLRPRIMTTLYEAGGCMAGVTPMPTTGERPPADYRADVCYPTKTPDWAGRLRPGMFLPRWASRITLVVSEVRVQRLQDISRADAITEGIDDVTKEVAPRDKSLRFWRRYRDGSGLGYVDDPIGSYASLWTEINGAGSWEDDPWVAAYTFRPFLSNIDAMEKRDAA